MARTRDIRPGFFKNEDLAECHPLARILFAGLWTLADRDGKLENRPKKLKAELLPYDDCVIADLLSQLSQFGFIAQYEVSNTQYIMVNNFQEHQRIHPKEPPSVIPDPEYIQNRVLPRLDNTQQVAKNAIPSSPTLPSLPPNPPGGSAAFDKFIEIYPKVRYPEKCWAIWQQNDCEAFSNEILATVERFKLSPQWQEQEGRYIPTSVKFLTEKRWKDGKTAKPSKKPYWQKVTEAALVHIDIDGVTQQAQGHELHWSDTAKKYTWNGHELYPDQVKIPEVS
jgi:hypothetical protein